MEKLNNRLIAFLDVLGFSTMLKENSLDDVYKNYSYFINEAKNKTFCSNPNEQLKRENFYKGKFISDSILLISNDTSDIYNINNFLMAINHLLSLGFKNKFCLRGAIGFGDIIIDEENGGFISKVIPYLLEEEKSQEWSGCAILDNAIKIILNAVGGDDYENKIKNIPDQSDLILFYPVHTKNGIKDSFVLHFPYDINSKQKEDGLNYLIEPKRNNVKNFFEYIENLPKDSRVQIPSNARLLKTRSGFCFSFIDN